MLNYAQQHAGSAQLIQADISTIKLSTLPRYDALLAANLLHVCEHPRAIISQIVAKICLDKTRAVLSWPTDQLSLSALFYLDMKHGRPLFESLKAHWLRWLSGLSGHALRIRAHNHGALMQMILGELQDDVVIEYQEVFENCQHIVVLAYQSK
jgi:hypothetical protein